MCTYCGCESIGVIGRFMTEHVDIVNQGGLLGRACLAAEPDGVRRHASALAELLTPHTQAEEVGLFAVLRRQEEYAEHVTSLCTEHASLDRQLSRLVSGDPTGIDAFIDALRRHIDREDNGLFPAAAIALNGSDWEEVDAVTPTAAARPAAG